MKIVSKVRAESTNPQQNEAPVRVKRLRIKSGVRAGGQGLATNHNQTLVRMRRS